MEVAALPPNETERLQALRDYDVLDTTTERAFDDLTELASLICGTPIALVSLVDENRQWFKSHHGLDVSETPRDVAFCAHAILHNELFEVTDSHIDPRFHDNPIVTAAPNVRFYAGAVLTSPDKHNLGTLCVIDHKPRKLDDWQRQCLTLISHQVESLLEMRRHVRDKENLLVTHQRDQQWKENRRQDLMSFAYRSSHDLRAPAIQVKELARLAGQDLAEGNSDGAVRDLDMIKDASDRLLALIDGVVDLGRAELIDEANRVIDFKRLVAESISHVNSLLHDHSVTVRSDIGVAGAYASGFLRLRHMLTQLISNAIQYRDPARSDAFVSVSVSDRDGKLRLVVEDNGLGIPDAKQVDFFEVFRRFHPTVCAGSGVGTAIVKKHAEALGATIELSSDRSGTRIEICLPDAAREDLACTA